MSKQNSFISRQLLNDEYTRNRINSIPDNTTGSLFVTEWLSYERYLYAVGLTHDESKYRKMKMNINPSLYVWSKQECDLRILMNHRLVVEVGSIKKVNTPKFHTTADTVIENLCKQLSVDPKWSMYQISTKTFSAATNLYFYIKQNKSILSYIKIPGRWSLEIFLICEFMVKYGCWPSKSFLGEIYNQDLAWISTSKEFQPKLLSIDIETVSPDNYRVPTGEKKSDIIFSVSMTKVLDSNNSIQYTFIHLPHKDYKTEYVTSAIGASERVLKCFHTEVDLLKEVCHIFESFDEWFFLVGYNSKGYDMLVLYTRIVLHMMPEAGKFFLTNSILTYGPYMAHIDIYLLYKKLYANETGLKSFKLEDVSQYCFQSAAKQKVDFSAVSLRHIFTEILQANETNQALPVEFPKYNANLAKITLYNDVDSILVVKLWRHFNAGNFFFDLTKSSNVAFGRIAQAEINECISGKLFLSALQLSNTVFCCTSNDGMATTASNDFSIVWDNRKLTSPSSLTSTVSSEKRFTGGFNYRSGKDIFKTVEMCDFVAYYPYLIEGFNISPETSSIVTVKFLSNMLHILFKENSAYSSYFLNDFDVFRFTSHKHELQVTGLIKPDIETAMNSKAYLNGCLDNASKISNLNSLKMLNDMDRLIVIDKRKRGALSILLENQNNLRTCAKSSMKNIEEEISKVNGRMKNLERIVKRSGKKTKYNEDELQEKMEKELKRVADVGTKQLTSEEFTLVTYFSFLPSATFSTLGQQQLKWYLEQLNSARDRCHAMYRYLKIVNSSFYGLLGSSFPGMLASLSTAAIVTCLARKFAIEGAVHAQSLGFPVALMDTDSFFLSVPKNSTVKNSTPQYLKNLNPMLQLEKKTYENVFIMAKKVYFARVIQSGLLISKGITKNGPAIWSQILSSIYTDFFINEKNTIRSVNDIPGYLEQNVFKFIYSEIAKKGIRSVVECNQRIKTFDEYKTETPSKRLIRNVLHRHPDYVFEKSVDFVHVCNRGVQAQEYVLANFTDEYTVRDLNLYKFLGEIGKPLYNIFSFYITQKLREKGICFVFSSQQFDRMMQNAFLNAREKFAWV